MSKPKPKFYVVWKGYNHGVYDSWAEAKAQVEGFAGARYKSFASREEATAAFRGSYFDYVGKNTASATKTHAELAAMGVELDAVAVDAACAGPPGPMEYQGVHIASGNNLFHQGPYPDGTNNIGEFLAIVHALALLKKEHKTETPIYSDSKIARTWIKAKTCKTKLERTPGNGIIFELIERAEVWLRTNEVTNPILVWDTVNWGEIPADFGRK